jgi:hypothetical protein
MRLRLSFSYIQGRELIVPPLPAEDRRVSTARVGTMRLCETNCDKALYYGLYLDHEGKVTRAKLGARSQLLISTSYYCQ